MRETQLLLLLATDSLHLFQHVTCAQYEYEHLRALLVSNEHGLKVSEDLVVDREQHSPGMQRRLIVKSKASYNLELSPRRNGVAAVHCEQG